MRLVKSQSSLREPACQWRAVGAVALSWRASVPDTRGLPTQHGPSPALAGVAPTLPTSPSFAPPAARQSWPSRGLPPTQNSGKPARAGIAP
eukprot:CAMPEP_0177401860 /NCGR_PEP_ID=MMETSP0368-20130122/59880_1 /TAXON_ID=447022 ORGANISM="Scrippsiella hangoei-like, Strain SHHI-4" /NCGR_SAMPLE_ID=MMETSP0368 /ASSEMBLY_ACC=CAM_ASM_000363 /LENGTH=90 /DNA_ID=CAMNT_0018869479 /DNA_START=160 /DNA_END=429 /DNA_ORIENTATION=+